MPPPQPPTAIVEPGKVTRGLLVRLGEPGGVLAGKILDAQTGEPITAVYKLFLPGKPEFFISSSADRKGLFERVVPRIPFLAEVTAPSYRTWQSESPILIPSKSRKELSIPLVRENKQQ
jgi:hypothetical protein